MKIQSMQPESESQLSSPNSTTSPIPTDFLFNLLIQNMGELLTNTDSSDTNLSESSLDSDFSDSAASISGQPLAQVESNILMAQLNFTDQLNNKLLNSENVESETSGQITQTITENAGNKINPSFSAPLDKGKPGVQDTTINDPNLASAKQNQAAVLNELSTVKALMQASQPTSEPVIEDEAVKVMNALSSDKKNSPSAIFNIDRELISDELKNSQAKSFEMIDKHFMSPKATDMIEKTIMPNFPEMLEKSTMSKSHVASEKPILTVADPGSKLATVSVKESTVQKQVELESMQTMAITSAQPHELSKPLPQEHKYDDFFAQLNQIISQQITQQINVGQKSASLVQENINTVEIMKNMPNPAEYDLKMEHISAEKILNEISELHEASIKIYPPELGSVIAKLKIDKNSAQVLILAENNQVKHIIETNLPLLRQHFQNANLNLTDIQVQTSSSGEKGQDNNQRDQSLRNNGPDETKQNEPKSPILSKSSSIIDMYA